MNDKSNGTKKEQPSRDQLRSALLSNQKPDSVLMTLFGQEIELMQPSLGAILSAREELDTKVSAAKMIITYACVPGTTNRIFEDGDIPQILKWPFGTELLAVQQAIAGLTGVDLDDIGDLKGILTAEEDLEASPLVDESLS